MLAPFIFTTASDVFKKTEAEEERHVTGLYNCVPDSRKDPSYVGISCTNYGYTDYSRQSRNFSPVSRVPLDPPAEGAPFATALTNSTYHSVVSIHTLANRNLLYELALRPCLHRSGATGRVARGYAHSLSLLEYCGY